MDEQNHYEEAFSGWLRENRVRYLAVDQQHRSVLARACVKSFDFLVYPPGSDLLVVELKGRICRSTSLERLCGLQTWVTLDDIRSLEHWERNLSQESQPVTGMFVFAYLLANIDVETDGRTVYDLGGRRYLFLAVSLANYRGAMRPRSRRWRTVSLGMDDFRRRAVSMEDLIQSQ